MSVLLFPLTVRDEASFMYLCLDNDIFLYLNYRLHPPWPTHRLFASDQRGQEMQVMGVRAGECSDAGASLVPESCL